ncbi:MAG TPA: NAD-dependent epimerase/dehydratase family protein [Thermoanaerobaculia bacterium]|nr:NAD-dependent epimerase/dehydratase family protein [Thermoanaerobaculia bacterium]
MKNVLITGGAGFIGSQVADAYVQQGHSVTVLDDLSSGERGNVNAEVRFVEGSVLDPRALAEAIGGGVDLVNHHAAQMDVRRSVADPAFDAEVNILGTLRLLEAARAKGMKRFVYASSGGATYGEPLHAPQREDHPQHPLSPYGCSKLAIEHYLHYFEQVHGLSYVALRYANVYGPRQRADGEAGVVAIFLGKMLRGEKVTINGTGEQTRDYVFVDDVVRANVTALELDISGPFNVGTGTETSVAELYRILREIIASDVEPEHAPAKRGEQMRSVLDGSKLRRAAGLPEPVGLRDGLSRTVEWFRRR